MANKRKNIPIKDLAKIKLLEYIGNPNNPILKRTEMSTKVLGYKSKNQLNCLYTAKELAEIEQEAFQLRMECSATVLLEVYDSLRKEAKKGNVQACKELLDRYQGKVVDKIEMNADINAKVHNIDDDLLDSQIAELQSKLTGDN